MTRFSTFIVVLGLLGLSGCSDLTPTPDYTIKVAPTADGRSQVAIPPECPRWTDNDLNFFDNQPMPQFGCADARNLALMVERPNDLLQGRPSGPANGVTSAGATMRYENNQTRGLVYIAPSSDNSADATTASTAASAMTGETPLAAPSASPLGK